MKTLFLAWQDNVRTRLWFPIGRLDADMARSRFHFGYTRGAEMAHKQAGLEPLDSFPDFRKVYESGELFPLFRNRVLGVDRKDFHEYLQRLDLDPDETDPITILSVTGGERETDSLEVFPKIERHKDGGFRCRFFLHGWRHVNESAQHRLLHLKAGDSLRVALELNNPATAQAVQLETSDDYHMVGWAPRYLVEDVCKAIAESPKEITATVIKVNPMPAPAKQRVLIELRGHWPKDYEPMSSPEFKPLVAK
jgi:hypothetical protein